MGVGKIGKIETECKSFKTQIGNLSNYFSVPKCRVPCQVENNELADVILPLNDEFG